MFCFMYSLTKFDCDKFYFCFYPLCIHIQHILLLIMCIFPFPCARNCNHIAGQVSLVSCSSFHIKFLLSVLSFEVHGLFLFPFYMPVQCCKFHYDLHVSGFLNLSCFVWCLHSCFRSLCVCPKLGVYTLLCHIDCSNHLKVLSMYMYWPLCFTVWYHRYSSADINVIFMHLAVLVTILPVFVIHILSTVVGPVTMFYDFVMFSGPIIFLDSYCRPCGYECMFFDSIIVLNYIYFPYF